ncbi:MAG: LysM peptidoglycan-binding domain-containing protein [Sphingobacteriales bacterium]|nr:MAG: LysM peptidoglycan-binding domain-containing protein [Sphingobacteriales bacterium]
MISILITMIAVSGCSSHRSARVDERSSQYAYKGKIHRVVKGDTLFSIAWRYGLDFKKLAEFNGIKSPYTIFPTQQIRLDFRSVNGKIIGSTVLVNGRKAGSFDADSAFPTSASRSKNKSPNSSSLSTNSDSQSSPKWQWPSYGKLIAPFQGDLGINKGIDLSGKLGEPVLAAASGRVVYAGSGLSGYGNLLIIKHNETFLSAYAHNDEISVKEGDLVKAGQRIADMGSSGTDRVKLHFEIRSEGSPVDPLKYLPKRQ